MKVESTSSRQNDVLLAFIVFTICCILSFFRTSNADQLVTTVGDIFSNS